MKLKRFLSILLISLAVLIVAGVIAFFVFFYYYVPQFMEAQDKRIAIVRYIGLCQTDEFYDEIMSLPDGNIRVSDLKTKLAAPTPETPQIYGYRYLISGARLLRSREYAGIVFVRKEGRFLCVAVVTVLPEPSLLHPMHGWWGECFEMVPEDGETNTMEAGDFGGKPPLSIKDWDTDPYEILRSGDHFISPAVSYVFDPPPAPEEQ